MHNCGNFGLQLLFLSMRKFSPISPPPLVGENFYSQITSTIQQPIHNIVDQTMHHFILVRLYSLSFIHMHSCVQMQRGRARVKDFDLTAISVCKLFTTFWLENLGKHVIIVIL